jgi:hypothetical protein
MLRSSREAEPGRISWDLLARRVLPAFDVAVSAMVIQEHLGVIGITQFDGANHTVTASSTRFSSQSPSGRGFFGQWIVRFREIHHRLTDLTETGIGVALSGCEMGGNHGDT